MTRTEILNEAATIVSGNRDKRYGKPEESFDAITNLWNAYLIAKGAQPVLVPEDAGIMLALLKIARIATGKAHADNFIDLAGYAACAGELSSQTQEAESGQ